jgi:molecular chaperone DnaJ
VPGDLYVHVQVETPVKLTDTQRDLLKQFEKSLVEGGPRHSPQSKSWFDRVKSFFD